jgi:hypothetical protein
MPFEIDVLSLDVLSADPGTPSNGQVWYNSTTGTIRSYQNGAVVTLGAGGGGTDTNAIHKNVAAEISTITEKTAPSLTDLLVIEDSAASNAKKRVQIGNLPNGQFGIDFYHSEDESSSSTTSATFQDKLTVVTPALTGTYLLWFYCELQANAANKTMVARLYNVTDATEICVRNDRPSQVTVWCAVTGFGIGTLTGSSKTYKIQYQSPDGSTQVTIRRARMMYYKVGA